MCGICAHTSDPGGAAIGRMLRLLTHRGPDDEGTYVDPDTGVALGARRLSIIDVAGGHQPLANEDGSIVAISNGEIYNYPELRRRLLDRGHRLATDCDTEVLVHLYEDFGDDLVHALDGMFAFVIWDSRRRRLFAARDRYGEKPFFYRHESGKLVIASELTALLDGLSTDVDPCPAAVDRYFVFGYVPGPGSIDARISQLPPAHRLAWRFDDGSLSIDSYWSPPVHDAQALDNTDLLAEVESLLERSVRSRMLSDVPLGIFLSGGVDSSIVAALSARHASAGIKTFTIGYDVGAVSETAAARRVSEAIGSEHHEVILEQRALAERAPWLLGRLDQPLADQAFIALHALAERARSEITVAVGGEGADELFAGYPRYRWLARAETVGSLMPAAASHALSSTLRRAGGYRSVRRMADVLAPVPSIDRHVDWVTGDRRHVRSLVYGPALREMVGEPPARMLPPTDAVEGVPVAGYFMRLDQMHWLPYDVLAKADRATMLSSLELRTPFLHRELAGLAASVPTHVHARWRGKSVLRGVRRRLGLPTDRGRAKRAFQAPVGDWLRGSLAPIMEEQLATSAMYAEGWFDRDGVRLLADEHLRGSHDRSNELWPIFAFGCWLDARRAGG